MKIKQWFLRRSNIAKACLMLAATFLIFGGLGLAMRPAQHNAAVQGVNTLKNANADKVDISEKSKIEVTKTEIETTEEEVPFATTQTYDGTLPKDTTVIKVEGRNGKKVVRTEVKTKDGEVNRSLISETITVPPVAKVVAIGTKIMAAKPKAEASKRCERPEATQLVCEAVTDPACGVAGEVDDAVDCETDQ